MSISIIRDFKLIARVTGFIDWAKVQIEEYASMFRKQVYTSDVDSKTVEDALSITYNQSKKVRKSSSLFFI